MNDPAPINRVFATFAFKRVLGLPINAQLEVDITAAPETRQQQIDAWLEKNYVEDN